MIFVRLLICLVDPACAIDFRAVDESGPSSAAFSELRKRSAEEIGSQDQGLGFQDEVQSFLIFLKKKSFYAKLKEKAESGDLRAIEQLQIRKEKNKAYRERPDVNERRTKREQSSAYKERKKRYEQRPEVKERRKQYQERPDVRNAHRERQWKSLICKRELLAVRDIPTLETLEKRINIERDAGILENPFIEAYQNDRDQQLQASSFRPENFEELSRFIEKSLDSSTSDSGMAIQQGLDQLLLDDAEFLKASEIDFRFLDL